MRTTITKRAQTVVPAALRERYGIKGGDYLEWIDDGQVIGGSSGLHTDNIRFDLADRITDRGDEPPLILGHHLCLYLVTDRDLGRHGQPALLDIDQEFAPALRTLADADLEAHQFLLSFRCRADDDQDQGRRTE